VKVSFGFFVYGSPPNAQLDLHGNYPIVVTLLGLGVTFLQNSGLLSQPLGNLACHWASVGI